MVQLNLEPMRAHLELRKGDPNRMHLMTMHMCKSDDEAISQLRKMLEIKGHIRTKALKRCTTHYPDALYKNVYYSLGIALEGRR